MGKPRIPRKKLSNIYSQLVKSLNLSILFNVWLFYMVSCLGGKERRFIDTNLSESIQQAIFTASATPDDPNSANNTLSLAGLSKTFPSL